MAIGERIRFFRNLRGFTLKALGVAAGFSQRTADIRMSQYESGTRTPKADMTDRLAYIFDISPKALDVPDIDTYIGLMHTLFALEDIYGLKMCDVNGKASLQVDENKNDKANEVFKMFDAWREQAVKLQKGEISKEQYDQWRYNYPEFDTTQKWAKVPPKWITDALVKKFVKD